MFEALRAFFHNLGPWVLGAITLGTMAFSVALLIGAIVAFPEDYFAGDRPRSRTHPVARLALKLAKNLLGLLFVVLGVILSFPGIPGQGFLTICVGLLMLDLPHKRALELRLLRNAKLRQFLNHIRARFRRPPLRLPAP